MLHVLVTIVLQFNSFHSFTSLEKWFGTDIGADLDGAAAGAVAGAAWAAGAAAGAGEALVMEAGAGEALAMEAGAGAFPAMAMQLSLVASAFPARPLWTSTQVAIQILHHLLSPLPRPTRMLADITDRMRTTAPSSLDVLFRTCLFRVAKSTRNGQ